MSSKQQHLLLILTPAIVLMLLFAACDTSIKTDEAEVGAPEIARQSAPVSEVYHVDTAKSKLTWIGAKITGRHNGVFEITSGEMHIINKELTGGKIDLNMRGTRSDDRALNDDSNKKLTTNLRSANFFDVERYPTATFIITDVSPYDSTNRKPISKPPTLDSQLRIKDATHLLTGNLTIKDKTRSVRFPAKIALQDNVLKARANFNIDRTKWGLVYRADKSMGNQTIRPEVNIDINLVANRATPTPETAATQLPLIC
ncbi:YceI family protein [Pontibacter pudoricolor]|uniref:YceI family protein n=1 Tax=Pontibacter pudoricolor TaxID=2694930 RepID=UPI001391EEEC|nr:YceI family protein [Pontibacter pudoricolor]